MQRLPRPILAAFAAVLAVASCGDPTGPSYQGGVLVPDVVVSGRVEGVDRPTTYELPLNAGAEFVVYFQASKAGLILRVVDPANNQILSQVEDWVTGGDLTDVHTSRIRVASATTLHVTVSARPETDFGDFRLRVTMVPRAPEARPAQIALNDTVANEFIDSDIDVDEFAFAGSAGEEIIAFLGAPGTGGSLGIGLHIFGPGGTEITGLATYDRRPELEQVSSGRIRLTATGTYTVRVDGWGAPLPLPYVFQIRRIDRRPELASPQLTAGDTVEGERVDHVGDIDEFVLSGTPGDAYNVFVQTLGTAPRVVLGEIEGSSTIVVRAQPGEPLMDGASGIFTIPETGRVTVRVSSEYDRYGLYRGEYRILAYRINPAPEHASAVLSPNLTVDERIELRGDRDRFTVAVGSDAVMNVSLRKPPGDGAGAIRLQLSGPMLAPISVPSYYLGVAEEGHISTGNVRLTPGTYEVVVDGLTSVKGGFVGAYELTVFRIDTVPERHPQSVAVGDTIAGELIDHLGDIDVYSFVGTAGQSVYTVLYPDDPYAQVDIAIVHPTLGRLVRSPDHIVGPLGAMRVELPETRTYQLRVGPYDTKDRRATGAYRAAVIAASPAPESRSAALTWAETVTQESTDYRGDIDEFVIGGPPGQEAVGTFWSSAGFSLNMDLSVIDPGSGDVLAQAGLSHQPHTGRFRIPAGGTMRLRVAERPMCMAPGYCYHATGRFNLQMRLIDRAPERVAARAVVGDTVAGEAVEFPGDIDEFSLAGAAGQRVTVVLRAGRPIYNDGTLTLEVIDPVTDATLGSVTATWRDAEIPLIVLPATRDYLVRVRGARDTHDGADYSFIVKAAA